MTRMDGDVESDSEHKEEEVYRRPSFHLVVSYDSGGEEELEDGQGHSIQEEANGTNTSLEPTVTDNTPSDEESDTIDDQTTLMFDYDSLPPEVRGLIDEYDGRGKVVMKEMLVKDKTTNKEERKLDDEEEDDEEDDNIMIESSLATVTETHIEGLDKKEPDVDESDKDQNDDNEQEKDEIVYSHQLISGGSILNDNKRRKIGKIKINIRI
jgi:hypothetical protein